MIIKYFKTSYVGIKLHSFPIYKINCFYFKTSYVGIKLSHNFHIVFYHKISKHHMLVLNDYIRKGEIYVICISKHHMLVLNTTFSTYHSIFLLISKHHMLVLNLSRTAGELKIQNFKTSYVGIKPYLVYIVLFGYSYFKTSYVGIKQVTIKEFI